ncbi:hypothetical protein BIT28_22820 [Photobacterium proteolyticum]|uniref:Uncharacterized protein n=1 Tax=Photobacterium proteolyticum TaxID=1903952 RepID=A0A1Q9GLS3_9GAMM|nr:hypothetical protein BIT28_22820 [Photobacterium proteolyticum]
MLAALSPDIEAGFDRAHTGLHVVFAIHFYPALETAPHHAKGGSGRLGYGRLPGMADPGSEQRGGDGIALPG